MELNREQLEQIMLLGTLGWTYSEVAKHLGVRPDELTDIRLTNPALNDALNRHKYNYDLFRIEQIEKTSADLKSRIANDYFKMLKETYDKNSDNEIIIREV